MLMKTKIIGASFIICKICLILQVDGGTIIIVLKNYR